MKIQEYMVTEPDDKGMAFVAHKIIEEKGDRETLGLTVYSECNVKLFPENGEYKRHIRSDAKIRLAERLSLLEMFNVEQMGNDDQKRTASVFEHRASDIMSAQMTTKTREKAVAPSAAEAGA